MFEFFNLIIPSAKRRLKVEDKKINTIENIFSRNFLFFFIKFLNKRINFKKIKTKDFYFNLIHFDQSQ